MATDAQRELQPFRWEDEHSAVMQKDGKILVVWNWLREYLDREEVERMVGVLQAALFGASEALPDFEVFLKAYPHRNSRRRHRKESQLAWDAMNEEERRLILVAVETYRKDREASTGVGVPDCFRWMGFTFNRASGKVRRTKADPPWRDWLKPEEVTPKPEAGPYAVYKPPDDCERCGGSGLVTVRRPLVKKPGYAYSASMLTRGYEDVHKKCPCPIGMRLKTNIPVFQPEKDTVA